MKSSSTVLQAINSLVLTLERGWAGKGKHQAVLKHLGLTKRHKVVEVPNTFEYRAAARKISHLLTIETKEMYDRRIAAELAAHTPKPPVIVHHPFKLRDPTA